ncbi:hypothetical protein EYF80_020266 [Liparis tanakae]|uniref:Uncharacterized protein n=1 Tax=Liparis tanakae TaxID=230148 RepID=A0A4Z2HWZ9_9TELE|nr:hypothetical protein EYF80_020266 [Liparis tanakae]
MCQKVGSALNAPAILCPYQRSDIAITTVSVTGEASDHVHPPGEPEHTEPARHELDQPPRARPTATSSTDYRDYGALPSPGQLLLPSRHRPALPFMLIGSRARRSQRQSPALSLGMTKSGGELRFFSEMLRPIKQAFRKETQTTQTLQAAFKTP